MTHTFQVMLLSLFRSWWTTNAKQHHRCHPKHLLIKGVRPHPNEHTIEKLLSFQKSEKIWHSIPEAAQTQTTPKPHPVYHSYVFLLLLLIPDSSARLNCVLEKCECLCHQIWLQGPPPLSPSGVNLSLSFPIKWMGTRVIILQRCWKNYREFIYKVPGTRLVINKRQCLLITGTTEMGGKDN